MDVVTELVLRALCAIHGIAGHTPTIGEIATVAKLSYGVVDRRLQKLCGEGLLNCLETESGRVRYRFEPTSGAYIFVTNKRLGRMY